MNTLSIYMFQCIILTLLTCCSVTNAQNPSSDIQPKTVIELAIFGDSEFGKAFNGDTQKMLNYWKQVIWSVHLKFRTLEKVDIFLQVNSLQLLKEEEELFLKADAFLDRGEYAPGSLIEKFGALMFEKAGKENFTSYDIAVLATRTYFLPNDVLGIVHATGRACSVDASNRQVTSVLALSMWSFEVPSNLAHEIGHLLTGTHDYFEEEYKNGNCKEFNATIDQYIMGGGNYLFSPCSQKLITHFLESDSSSCLRSQYTNIVPVIDTYTDNQAASWNTGLSLAEQCKVHLDYSRYSDADERYSCSKQSCQVKAFELRKTGRETYDALDYTSCDDFESTGKCFWGTCVPVEGHLVNVASGKCLGTRNPIAGESYPVLDACHGGQSPTLLDTINIMDNILNWIQLTVPQVGNSHVKCLGYKSGKNVTFEKCTDFHPGMIWELRRNNIPQKRPEGKFFVFNLSTQSCLTLSTNMVSVDTTTECDLEDDRQLWTYVKANEKPKEIQGEETGSEFDLLIAVVVVASWF